MPDATLPNPKRPSDWKTPRVGRFSLLPNAVCSPAVPGGPEKPACLRFKSGERSTRAGSICKPAGRWFAGFQATPTRGIKTQTYVIFCTRASRRSADRAPTGPPPQAYSASPESASISVTSVMVKSGTARRGSSLASWSSSVNDKDGARGQLQSGSSLRKS